MILLEPQAPLCWLGRGAGVPVWLGGARGTGLEARPGRVPGVLGVVRESERAAFPVLPTLLVHPPGESRLVAGNPDERGLGPDAFQVLLAEAPQIPPAEELWGAKGTTFALPRPLCAFLLPSLAD